MTFTPIKQPAHDRAEAARKANTPWRRNVMPWQRNSQMQRKRWEEEKQKT